eukprot:scaffold25041_cov66-Cyclotella_meneghiniana.AAC.8
MPPTVVLQCRNYGYPRVHNHSVCIERNMSSVNDRDGMNESGSVAGTSLSTAANFSCSEYVSIGWYFGAALIGVGMWLLSAVALVET